MVTWGRDHHLGRKRDSEIKILVGCTEEEKLEIYKTHNETEYMKGILIRRQIQV